MGTLGQELLAHSCPHPCPHTGHLGHSHCGISPASGRVKAPIGPPWAVSPRNWGTNGFTALIPGVWPPSKTWGSRGLGTHGRGVGTSPELALMCHSHQVRVIPAGHPAAQRRWQQQRELNGAARRG